MACEGIEYVFTDSDAQERYRLCCTDNCDESMPGYVPDGVPWEVIIPAFVLGSCFLVFLLGIPT